MNSEVENFYKVLRSEHQQAILLSIFNPPNIVLKEICPRGNNKVVFYISLYHDKCLLFMLELSET